MMDGFTYHGRLPSMNDYTAKNRANPYAGAKVKQDAEEGIMWSIRGAKCKHHNGKVRLHIDYYEPNARRDPDNIMSAKKFILDAMVTLHVIRGDSQKWLAMPEPFVERVFVDRDDPRVEVSIEHVYQ